jgi:hypothetical protein
MKWEEDGLALLLRHRAPEDRDGLSAALSAIGVTESQGVVLWQLVAAARDSHRDRHEEATANERDELIAPDESTEALLRELLDGRARTRVGAGARTTCCCATLCCFAPAVGLSFEVGVDDETTRIFGDDASDALDALAHAVEGIELEAMAHARPCGGSILTAMISIALLRPCCTLNARDKFDTTRKLCALEKSTSTAETVAATLAATLAETAGDSVELKRIPRAASSVASVNTGADEKPSASASVDSVATRGAAAMADLRQRTASHRRCEQAEFCCRMTVVLTAAVLATLCFCYINVGFMGAWYVVTQPGVAVCRPAEKIW